MKRLLLFIGVSKEKYIRRSLMENRAIYIYLFYDLRGRQGKRGASLRFYLAKKDKQN